MTKAFLKFYDKEINNIRDAGLIKHEFVCEPGTFPEFLISERHIVNMCSGNYLGLAEDPTLHQAAQDYIAKYGFHPMAPRIHGGTREIHRKLEQLTSEFLGTDESIVFGSEYFAHSGLFEALFSDQDMIFCDGFVQPSLIEGIQLASAKYFFYRNHDIDDLEVKLKRSRQARFRCIVTEGVFALDGRAAKLQDICSLAEKYNAMVFVSDAHGLGIEGEGGRGTHESKGVLKSVDVITGSYSLSIGATSGGFISGRSEIINWLRQRSRPYIFSEAMEPVAAAMAHAGIKRIQEDRSLRDRLTKNVNIFCHHLSQIGCDYIEGTHPIVSLVVPNVIRLQRLVDRLFDAGFYVMGLCYPTVPKDAARVKMQITASHSEAHLEKVTTLIGEFLTEKIST